MDRVGLRGGVDSGERHPWPKTKPVPNVCEAGNDKRLSEPAKDVRITKKAKARKTNGRALGGFAVPLSRFRCFALS